MMGRTWTISLTAIAVSAFALAIVAEPALAATSPAEAGSNFGDLIRGIFKPIVLSIGGVVGVAAIAKRDYLLALMLVGVTIIILGFLVEPSPYESWGDDILRTVFGVSGTIGPR